MNTIQHTFDDKKGDFLKIVLNMHFLELLEDGLKKQIRFRHGKRVIGVRVSEVLMYWLW